jgi:energy-coupling factor transporter ATP-binding protein EcfA2
MWSDNEAETDLLQFTYLAKAITRLIQTPHLLPTTIGVFGDWGSGKSTLLKIIHTALKDDPDTLSISFNGWLFEGYEDAKTALMGTILDDLQDRISKDQTLLDKCQGLLSKLVQRVNWLQLASMVGRFGIPAVMGLHHSSIGQMGQEIHQVAQALPGAIVQQAKDFDTASIKQFLNEVPDGPENIRRNIRDFRKDFALLLEKANIQRLVVTIDDLDRCLPENIIETLEAIKLFLFVPGTAFIIGADERLVQYAVRQRFPELPGPEAEVGRDYLEKLIQIPIRLPALAADELQSYLNLLFAQRDLTGSECVLAANRLKKLLTEACVQTTSRQLFTLKDARTLFEGGSIPESFENDLDLVAQISPILAPGLGGNPRRSKRFLNTLMLRMEISEDRGLAVKRRILAKLMLLEYLKPEFFRQIAQLQAQQDGFPQELPLLEKRLRIPEQVQLGDQVLVRSREAGAERISAYTEAPDEKLQTTNGSSKATTRNPPTQRTRDAYSTDEMLPPSAVVWLADGWMQDWLRSEPSLGGVDLRPYFSVAHDRVGVLENVQIRLSPAAEEVLRKLLDSKSPTQSLGLRQSEGLNPADANALFESLASRVRQAEILDASTPFEVLFKLIERRKDLLSQLVALLGSLPETKLPPSAAPNILRVIRGTSLEAVGKGLLLQWMQGPNAKLANASRAILNRS